MHYSQVQEEAVQSSCGVSVILLYRILCYVILQRAGAKYVT